MIGVTIRENIGLGDKLQFSSLPENYFRAKGEKLLDVSKAWIFDHNPFVVRDDGIVPEKTVELWNFPTFDPWKNPRAFPEDPAVYLSNAEVTASRFKVPTVLNRPRLYCFEDYPFASRWKILFHVQGKSHGRMPEYVIKHVIDKYGPSGALYHLCTFDEPDIGLPRIIPATFWDMANEISRCRMFIGVDSGPSWIAACYPDVVAKKVRIREVHGQKPMRDWVPLEIANCHAHWDDRIFQICNVTEDDLGAFPSYRRL